MKYYQPQSKNVSTLVIGVSLILLGYIVELILFQTGHGPNSLGQTVNPYLMALQPLVFAGVPILIVANFIFGIYALGREEKNIGRYQVATLMLLILVIGYLVSFLMFNHSGQF